jgi:phospholipase/lecithinase/hemolysin
MKSFSARAAAALAKPWLLFSIVLAFVSFAPDRAAADDRFRLHQSIDRLVVFGTSLSDPGNAFALSGQHLEPPYLTLIPLGLVPESETPYKVGGNHFSNGDTWVEQLALPGLWTSARPAYVESRGGSSNYAVAGTTARNGVAGEVWLSEQVRRFLKDVGPRAPSDAIYVIEVGGNDVRAALFERNPALILAATDGVKDAVRRLHSAGARKFLVWNVPNLARTPAIQTLENLPPPNPFAGIAASALQLTQIYNAGLDQAVKDLLADPDLKNIQIIQFDAFAKLEHVANNPATYGLENVTHACIRPGTSRPSRCPNPDGYLFWDGIHPTRAVHAIIAYVVGKELEKALADD